MAEIKFHNSTLTTYPDSSNWCVQKISLEKRTAIFDITKAGDSPYRQFTEGSRFYVGTLVGFGLLAYDPDSTGLAGTLDITMGGTGGAQQQYDIHIQNIRVSGSWMTGGPAIVQMQFQATRTN